jgi:hypothetical protein
MLPFDQKPWAKTLATIVILVSFFGLAALALAMYYMGNLHIPEGVGIVLLLLLFLPPNIAVLNRAGQSAQPPAYRPTTTNPGYR